MILLIAAAHAATLEVPLKDRSGTFLAPRSMEVSLGFKGGPASTPVEATWDNVESNALSIACTDKATPPDDDSVEQLTVLVGADKWTLAPGSAVHFTCAAGAKALVVDLHGTMVGTFPGGVTLTVNKAKNRAAR